MLAAGDDTGGSVQVTTRRGKAEVTIHPIVFRAAGEKCLLLPESKARKAPRRSPRELSSTLAQLYREGPDAIVVTDTHGVIRSANEAFLGLTDTGSLSDMKGKSLAEYLARGSVDLKVLTDNAARSGKMRMYCHPARGRLRLAIVGRAVCDASQHRRHVGLRLRDPRYVADWYN